jgi:hypothetical protein
LLRYWGRPERYDVFPIMMMADNWNFFWYAASYLEDENKAEEYVETANRWQSRMSSGFQASMGFFVLGRVCVAFAVTKILH